MSGHANVGFDVVEAHVGHGHQVDAAVDVGVEALDGDELVGGVLVAGLGGPGALSLELRLRLDAVVHQLVEHPGEVGRLPGSVAGLHLRLGLRVEVAEVVPEGGGLLVGVVWLEVGGVDALEGEREAGAHDGAVRGPADDGALGGDDDFLRGSVLVREVSSAVASSVDGESVVAAAAVRLDVPVGHGDLDVLAGVGVQSVRAGGAVLVVERVVGGGDDAAAGERLLARVRGAEVGDDVELEAVSDDAVVGGEHDAVAVVEADVVGERQAGSRGRSLVGVLRGLSSLSSSVLLVPGSAEWPGDAAAVSAVDSHGVVAAGAVALELERDGDEEDFGGVGHVDGPDAGQVVVVVAVRVEAGRLDRLVGRDAAAAVVDDRVFISVGGCVSLLGEGNGDQGGGELENGFILIFSLF